MMQVDIIFLFILIVEVFFLCLVEHRLWNTWLTPAISLTVPFTAVAVVAAVVSTISDDIPDMYYPALIVWIVGIPFFMIPSVLLAPANKKMPICADISNNNDDYYKLFRNIAFVIVAINLMRLRSTMLVSAFTFGSDELSEEYEATGVLAHLNQLLYAIFPYMMYKADRYHKSAYLIIVLTLVSMFAVAVKSWIIIPLFAGMFLRIHMGKTKLGIKVILIPIVCGVLVFFVSYYLIMVVSGQSELSSEWFEYLYFHFVDYLIGGLLAFSLDFQQGILEPVMTESLFGPLVNIFQALTGGEFVNVLNPVFYPIGELGENNVRTFMGTIICFSQDVFFSIVIVILMSIMLYIYFLMSRHTNSIFIVIASCYNLAFLLFGYFDFYWLTLSSYEIPIICLVISYCLFSKHNPLLAHEKV